MRISTSMFHEHTVASILNKQGQIEETQNRLATGQRMLRPSDDPAAATRALELRQAIATTDQYQNNADAATSRLNLEESALMGVGDLLKRVRDLTIQANNAGLADSDRQAIAVEMRQNFDALLGVANTRDANGEYLFAGNKTQDPPFKVNTNKITTIAQSGEKFERTLNNVSYTGDQGRRFLQIATADQIATGDSGWDVFMDIPTGNFNGVFVAAPGNNSSDATIDPGIVVDLKKWQPDTYNISFTRSTYLDTISTAASAAELENITLSAGGLPADIYEIRNSAGELVTSGSYRSGDAIEFMGIKTSITGTPVFGDTFNVAPVGADPHNIGTAFLDHSEVIDSTAWQQDVYTLSFPTDGQYRVTDSTNNIVTLGTYKSGYPITFRGIQTKITGAPAATDKFIIAPGAKQDVFSTINAIATTMENAKGEEANAMLTPAVARALQDIDQAYSRVLDTRAALGSRLNRVSTAKDTNNYFSIQLNSTLSTLEDLDYTTAISKLSLQTLGMQAAQQAYIKVSGLSLFNRLG